MAETTPTPSPTMPDRLSAEEIASLRVLLEKAGAGTYSAGDGSDPELSFLAAAMNAFPRLLDAAERVAVLESALSEALGLPFLAVEMAAAFERDRPALKRKYDRIERAARQALGDRP